MTSCQCTCRAKILKAGRSQNLEPEGFSTVQGILCTRQVKRTEEERKARRLLISTAKITGGDDRYGEPPGVRAAAQPGRPAQLAWLLDRTLVTRASKGQTRCTKKDTPNDSNSDPAPRKREIRGFQQVSRGTTQNIPHEYVEAARPKRRRKGAHGLARRRASRAGALIASAMTVAPSRCSCSATRPCFSYR
jgi:hypothetical protein